MADQGQKETTETQRIKKNGNYCHSSYIQEATTDIFKVHKMIVLKCLKIRSFYESLFNTCKNKETVS